MHFFPPGLSNFKDCMKLLKICGSLPLAIALLAILAAVLVPATCVETWYGSAAARFGFYGAWWFTLLCACWARTSSPPCSCGCPGKSGKSASSSPISACWPCWSAACSPGGTASTPRCRSSRGKPFRGRMKIRSISSFRRAAGEQAAADVCVPFAPGPFNWGDYADYSWFPWRLASRDQGVLYDRDGVRLETLDYYADSRQISLPLLVLQTNPGLASPHGMMSGHGGSMPLVLTVQTSQHPHGAGRAFGLGMRQSLAGGQRVVFWMTGSGEETAAFRESAPDGPLGKKGRIVLRAAGRNYQFAVDQLRPKTRLPLGKSGLEIELVKFDPAFLMCNCSFAAARRSRRRCSSWPTCPSTTRKTIATACSARIGSTRRKNPATAPPDAETLHEVARPRIDILQGADQKLDRRGWRAGKWSGGEMPTHSLGRHPEGELKVFENTADATSLTVLRFEPSAKPDTRPEPVEFSKMKAAPRRQVRVRLTVDGQAEEFWLAPSPAGPQDSSSSPNVRRVVAGKKRQVAVALCPDEIDLGVEVYLRKFRRKLDPGAAMASHYSSLVDFRDRKEPRAQPGEIRRGEDEPAGRVLRPGDRPLLSPLPVEF